MYEVPTAAGLLAPLGVPGLDIPQQPGPFDGGRRRRRGLRARLDVFALLAAGVPLTLLLDLVAPFGPDSAWILAEETAGGRVALSA